METLGLKARSLNLRAHLGSDRHADALSTLYFALFSAHPFAGGVEPTIGTGNYGRATVSNNSALWGTIALGTTVVANLAAVVWPAATALWSVTGPLTHWGVFSASTAGDLWYIGECDEAKVVGSIGDQPRLLAGAIVISQG